MVSFKWDQKKALEIAKQEAYEEAYAEGYKEGFEEGAQRVLMQVVPRLLKNKCPVPLIAKVTELSVEEIREIARENGLMLGKR